METENKWYLNSGCIDKDFYDRFIKDEVEKKHRAKFAKLLKNEEDFIEYYRVGINNPTDSKWTFSSLWFFDIGLKSGYYPVFLEHINTSSGLAMTMCGMDRDDDEEDEEYYMKTLDELLEFAPNGTEENKNEIKRILTL